jgi:hypothetical protein
MSSDDETDDELFDLIKRRREKRKTRKGKRKIQNINDDILTAAENFQLSVTRLILRLGADPNATDFPGVILFTCWQRIGTMLFILVC